MKYDLCVIGGLGHVGLPLSIVFACKGLKVLILDKNTKTADIIKTGEMPFIEEGGDAYLKEALANGNLDISFNVEDISKSRALVVVIGTPVDGYLNPKLELILSLLDEISPHVVDGQYIIMRSTLLRGTTQIGKEYFEKQEKQVKVTFCPERIAQGKAFTELFMLPQLISAFEEEEYLEMEKLFSYLGCETIRLTPIEAELGKLFTNARRYCQFAISNQFYMTANNYNLDFFKIFDAIKYKYPRIYGMPAPGLSAGPCLYKDTLQLAAFNNNQFGIGYAAITTNEGLPSYIVESLKSKMNLKDKVVGILGMAFKADSDDNRGSLAYKLRRILRWEAKEVLCTDVYINEPDFLPAREVINQSDVLILACPHREYRALDLEGKKVVDVWNFFGKGGLI
jgi:UDP-N-acetyl-D-mannosaminuronic acid dehydrogenase